MFIENTKATNRMPGSGRRRVHLIEGLSARHLRRRQAALERREAKAAKSMKKSDEA